MATRNLVEALVSATVAIVAITTFSVVMFALGRFGHPDGLVHYVWPMAASSAIASVLVMSLLYHELRRLMEELEGAEASAQQMALHDQLTGLPNRLLLNDRLEQALFRYEREGIKFAVLMLDLDHFKQVNDTHGHPAGDLLVKQVGERLSSIVRATDTIARIGGDEFVVIQSNVRGAVEVSALSAKIVNALSKPHQLEGREARVSASVGAVIVSPAASAADLLRRADITLYKAKGAGRGCFRIFSEEMDAAVQRRDKLETALRRALSNDEGVTLHYQPQVACSGELTGFEGLLRWNDEELGSVTPAEVIPLAEETGLIHSLGEQVFRAACRTARRFPGHSFAVNLSPAQFRTPNLPDRLRLIAAEFNVACRQIELEITENLLIEQGDLCASAIQDLRTMGFRVALDDFGTGYSSLGYLRQFQVDKIKLDRAFIEAGTDPDAVAIIRAAVHLGHAMNLEVVAEGISSIAQEQIARQAGCTGLQGYLYAPALPEADLPAFIEAHNSRSVAA